MTIPLSQPDITQKEINSVVNVLKTPHLALGPKLKEFEDNFTKYIGVKHAVAVNSGTSGLHLLIRALGIKNGDEIITTPFSFIASANCILYEGAKPVFVDIDPNTLNIDPLKIEKAITKRTKAMVIVDIFGHPADWAPILKIAKKYNLKVIEDSCEALGAMYKSQITSANWLTKSQITNKSNPPSAIRQLAEADGGQNQKSEWRKCGNFGDAAVFAFYPNKQITSVRYNTPVLIRKNGTTKLVKIGKLMDFMIDDYWEPRGYECLAFDKNGKISWQKIKAFIKHGIHSEILKIHLEKGREVEITKSHSVFTIKDNKIKEVLGKDLKNGDYLIVPRKLPVPINPIKTIDVLDYIDRENIKLNKKKIIIKNNRIGGGGGRYINRKIEINKKFCKLLGYFAAEGGYDLDKSGGGLRFTFGYHEKDSYVKEVKEIFNSIWPNFKVSIIPDKKNHKCTILCGGLLHSELFRNLGCGENVYTKNTPDIIWNTSDKNKLAFIEGLLNGDGHTRIINGSESKKLGVASENLSNGLHYLLLTLGIQSRLEKEKYYSKNGKLCYKYSCEILGFNKQKTSRENTVPVEFLSLNNKSSWLQRQRIREKKSVSLKTIKEWLAQGKIDCPSFLLEDINVLRIKKIGREKFHEFVYDFEVKGLENFVGGYGAVCLHNTGEGGIIVTDNKDIADNCRSMTNQGRKVDGNKWLEHVQLGYNYRMSDINAALGVAQLSRIKEILGKRDNVAKMYNDKLANLSKQGKFTLPFQSPWAPHQSKLNAGQARRSWFVYVIQLTEKYARADRDKIMQKLRESGIQCSNYFQCIHLQPFYKKLFGYKGEEFPIAEGVSDRTIALPFYSNLKEKQIDYIVKNLKKFL